MATLQQNLSSFYHIDHIRFSDEIPIGDDGFAVICRLTNLKSLLVDDSQITAEGSIGLKMLKHLKTLSYSNVNVYSARNELSVEAAKNLSRRLEEVSFGYY